MDSATKAIMSELETIEKTQDVTILLAVESGSRMWGFPSQDSDYDVRYIYARHKDDYLKLEPMDDYCTWLVNDELDIVGWDLDKTLKLLRKSNPSLFEWLDSTTVYKEHPASQIIRELAPKCLDTKTLAKHYIGMARKHDMRYLRNVITTPKRYLYAVRSLLAAKYVISEQKPVPMAFSELKDSMLEQKMQSIVDGLVVDKMCGIEKEPCMRIPELDAWLYATSDTLYEKSDALKHQEPPAWDMLDKAFIDVLDQI